MDRDFCILMELCKLSVLKFINIPDRIFDKYEITKIIIGAASGLEQIHNAKMIHRDIKTENIMIGSDSQIKICDMGLISAISRKKR